MKEEQGQVQLTLEERAALFIIAGILTVALALFIYFLCRGQRRSHVLLLGISDSGKTTLFSHLAIDCEANKYGARNIISCTSIQENVSSFKVPESKDALKLVDLPGNDKIRFQVLDRYKSQARAFIYLIDASTIQENLRDVAEFLYRVLTDPVFGRSRLPMLVACNKQDLTKAKGPAVIRNMLEKELNTLRQTQAGQLGSIEGNKSAKSQMARLGRPDRPFSFEEFRGVEVTFTECTCTLDKTTSAGGICEPDLSGIRDWLKTI